MAERELGASFAIHGGGSDLVFPHHENEIAQSEAAGRPFAQVWMHNGMVETAAEKMSKSEGNIFQLNEALDEYGREAVVLYLISRALPAADGVRGGADGGSGGPGRAASELLQDRGEGRLRGRLGGTTAGRLRRDSPGVRRRSAARGVQARRWRMTSTRRGRWPRCLSWSPKRIASEVRGRRRALAEMLELVGLGALTQPDEGVEADEEAQQLMPEREEARAAKDFERADEIRDRLAELGWEVRDSADGPRLVRKVLMATRSSTASSRCRGGAGEAAGAPGLAGAGDLGRGAGAALRVARPPGGGRRGRSVSLRRCRGMLRRPDALIVALDQVQDPRNLGAVCRSAEVGRGGRGGHPRAARGEVTAGRLQGLGRRGRAPRDRPRPQPRRLAGGGEGGRLLDLGRRRRGRAAPWASTSRARRCSSSAARARACGRASPPPATASSRCRGAARSSR